MPRLGDVWSAYLPVREDGLTRGVELTHMPRFQSRQRYLIVANFPTVTFKLESVKGGKPEQSIDALIDALKESVSRLETIRDKQQGDAS